MSVCLFLFTFQSHQFQKYISLSFRIIPNWHCDLFILFDPANSCALIVQIFCMNQHNNVPEIECSNIRVNIVWLTHSMFSVAHSVFSSKWDVFVFCFSFCTTCLCVVSLMMKWFRVRKDRHWNVKINKWQMDHFLICISGARIALQPIFDAYTELILFNLTI